VDNWEWEKVIDKENDYIGWVELDENCIAMFLLPFILKKSDKVQWIFVAL
jgi:hypothetical protein